MKRVSEYLSVQRLHPARRVHALQRMLELVPDGHADLRQHIEEAIAAQERAVRMARMFRAKKEGRVMHSDDARSLDIELDRTLSTTADAMRGMLRVTPRDEPVYGALESLIALVFPNGVAAITSQPFVYQHQTVKSMLDDVSTEDESFVQPIPQLGLGRFFRHIRKLNKEYGALLTEANGVGRAAVNTASREAFEPFASLIARILGRFPTNSDSDVDARETLLAPVSHQEAEASLYRRRKRTEGVKVIDELDELDELEEGPTDDASEDEPPATTPSADEPQD